MKGTARYQHQATFETESDFYKGFFADIVLDTQENTYNVWLWHEKYCTKEYVVGFPKDDSDIIDMIAYQCEEYIPLFIENRRNEESD